MKQASFIRGTCKDSNQGVKKFGTWKSNEAKVFGREIMPKSIFKWLLNKYAKQRADSLNQPHKRGVMSPPKQVEQIEATKQIYVSKKKKEVLAHLLRRPMRECSSERLCKCLGQRN